MGELLAAWLPARRPIVVLSGVIEMAFVIGILMPVTSHDTAIAAIVFLLGSLSHSHCSGERRVWAVDGAPPVVDYLRAGALRRRMTNAPAVSASFSSRSLSAISVTDRSLNPLRQASTRRW